MASNLPDVQTIFEMTVIEREAFLSSLSSLDDSIREATIRELYLNLLNSIEFDVSDDDLELLSKEDCMRFLEEFLDNKPILWGFEKNKKRRV